MRIKQVENALSLLQYYADTGQPSTLTEISNHFDWPRSSTYNLLNTLSYHGYLYEPHQRGHFYPTPKLLDLGLSIIDKAPLPAFFDKLMVELRDKTQETVWLAAKDRKSTRLNSSHVAISYAVFCLKKKTEELTLST